MADRIEKQLSTSAPYLLLDSLGASNWQPTSHGAQQRWLSAPAAAQIIETIAMSNRAATQSSKTQILPFESAPRFHAHASQTDTEATAA